MFPLAIAFCKLYEVIIEFEAGGTAFFWVKLNSYYIIPGDGTTESDTINRGSGHNFFEFRISIVAVNKVEIRVRWYFFQDRVPEVELHLVPAHMGYF